MLARTNIGRLACARNNQPYVVPIHFDLDPSFSIVDTQGLKITGCGNPLFVEIDDLFASPHCKRRRFGRYELPPLPEYQDLRRVAEQLFQRHPMWWQPAAVPLAGHEQRKPVVFRIRIDRITGRRGSTDGVKAHVAENVSDVRAPGWLARVLRRM